MDKEEKNTSTEESNDDQLSVRGLPQSDENKALSEFVQQSYKDSITTIKDFAKLMIPLCTGLITAYFGLLEFFGDASSRNIVIDQSLLMIPAYFWLTSLMAFIASVFPIYKKVIFGNTNSKQNFRNSQINIKYSACIIGFALFIIGLFTMINVVTIVMNSPIITE